MKHFAYSAGPHAEQEKPIDSPFMQRLSQLATRFDVPIVLHMEGAPGLVKDFASLLREHSRVRYVWAHNCGRSKAPVIRAMLENHPVRYISRQVLRVAITAFANHCRWPKSRPNVEDHEDPERPLLPSHEGLDFIGLKLGQGESPDSLMIEPATPGGCSFQPAMYRIPGDFFDSSNGGLVLTLDTEGGNFIKRGAAVLESMIRSACCRAEGLPTSSTLVATTLSPPGLVETIPNNTPGGSFFRGSTVWVGTVETLHGWWTFLTSELYASN